MITQSLSEIVLRHLLFGTFALRDIHSIRSKSLDSSCRISIPDQKMARRIRSIRTTQKGQNWFIFMGIIQKPLKIAL